MVGSNPIGNLLHVMYPRLFILIVSCLLCTQCVFDIFHVSPNYTWCSIQQAEALFTELGQICLFVFTLMTKTSMLDILCIHLTFSLIKMSNLYYQLLLFFRCRFSLAVFLFEISPLGFRADAPLIYDAVITLFCDLGMRCTYSSSVNHFDLFTEKPLSNQKGSLKKYGCFQMKLHQDLPTVGSV